MNKRIYQIVIVVLIAFQLVSCQTADILLGEEKPSKEWSIIEESAQNSTINIYVSEAKDDMRMWFNNNLSKNLSETYGMTLEFKVLSFDNIVKTLEQEKVDEVKSGSIDLLILKDDEFRILKEMDLLYADLKDKVPNFQMNINHLDHDVLSEHGYALDGVGVPFGREQFIMVYDEDVLEVFPEDADEVKRFAEKNPNMITYPNPMTDEIGGEFVRTMIYEVVGKEAMMKLMDASVSMATVESVIKPGLEFLQALDPYMYKEEDEYLKSIDKLNEAFVEGIVFFSMTDDYAYIEEAVKEEIYPAGARAFILQSGTIQDTLYFAVPVNAANKTGSIVTMNQVLSVDMQLDKYIPSRWGNLPILDLNLMAETDIERFSKANIKRHTVKLETLDDSRFLELPKAVNEKINALWDIYVNQNNSDLQ